MQRQRIYQMVLMPLLAVIIFVAKMAMAGIPNVEPVSLLIIAYTIVFGWKAIIPVYIYVGLEILIWGPGIWNLMYFYIWLILVALTMLFRKMKSRLGWGILSGLFGLSFGLLCFPVSFLTGGLTFAVTGWISGIMYDAIHAAGNFVMAFLLLNPLVKALKRITRIYGNPENTEMTIGGNVDKK